MINPFLSPFSYTEYKRITGQSHCLLGDKDIGIIAPYHAQCLKLRKALANVGDGIKVGSVEEFQGQVCLSHNVYLTKLTANQRSAK